MGSPTNRLRSTPTNTDEGKIHPLLNDEIIAKIMKYIWNSSYRKSELLRCREVCKTWKHVGTKVFEKLYQWNLFFWPQDFRELEKFVEVWENTDDLLLFQKFTLSTFIINENPQIFQKFMKLFSPFIPNLRIQFLKDLTIIFDPFTFQEMDLSNLKELTLDSWVDGCDPREKPSGSEELKEGVSLFEPLLKSSNNLQKFTFSTEINISSEKSNLIYGNWLIPNLPKSVQCLTLTVNIANENLEKLKKVGLRLIEFKIDLIDSSLSIECLMDFIESQKDTLIQLVVGDNRKLERLGVEPIELTKLVIPSTSTFPVCPKLKVLEIRRAKESTLSSIQAFPSLEKLWLEGTMTGIEYFPENDSEVELETPCLSVKDFKIGYKIANSILISKIARSFPDLSKLRILLGDTKLSVAVLQTVSQEMPNLKELHIYYPNCPYTYSRSKRRWLYCEAHRLPSSVPSVKSFLTLGQTRVYHKNRPRSGFHW